MAKTRESITTEQFSTDEHQALPGNGTHRNGNGKLNGNGDGNGGENGYGEQNIQILEGLEAVRVRPGMYIGATDQRGLHHLIYEVVDNSIDEVMAGIADTITVVIHADGSVITEDNGRGIPVTPLLDLGPAEGTGTTTSFIPDLEVMETRDYSFDILAQRFREMAYLNRELTISMRDERSDREATFYFEGGLVSFVRYLNKNRSCIQARPVSTVREIDNVKVELAVQYNDSWTSTEFSFANGINTADGGMHITGFRSALTRSLNDYARKMNLLKEKDSNLTGDDVRQGLTAVVSVKMPNPQFEAQTKAKLNNAEVRPIVETVTAEMLLKYLEETPSEAKAIIEKCLLSARAREAARSARDLIQRKNALIVVNCTSWKGIPQVAQQNKVATATSRLSFPYVAKYSTSNVLASTKCL